MKNYKRKKVVKFLLIVFAATGICSFVFPKILSYADFVVTTVDVVACQLTIKAYPEKRAGTIPDLSENLNVQIYSPGGEYQGEFSVTTNNVGQATVDLCSLGIYVTSGVYDFYIRGTSELRKNYSNYGFASIGISSIDFTGDGPLYSGETSIVYDNVINTLDLSNQIGKMETFSSIQDLNKDGEVNALDISITIANYGREGDCSPKESSDGVCD